MLPNGDPASKGDMPSLLLLMLLVADSLERVLPMAALPGCDLERKLRGGILSCEVGLDDVVDSLPVLPLLLTLHPREERLLICSLDRAGDGGALRGRPGLSKGLPAGDCSRSADMPPVLMVPIYSSSWCSE